MKLKEVTRRSGYIGCISWLMCLVEMVSDGCAAIHPSYMENTLILNTWQACITGTACLMAEHWRSRSDGRTTLNRTLVYQCSKYVGRNVAP